MRPRFVQCVHCGREAAHAVTIELRRADSSPFEVPDEKRLAYVCPRCLEQHYADLFGTFGNDPWLAR